MKRVDCLLHFFQGQTVTPEAVLGCEATIEAEVRTVVRKVKGRVEKDHSAEVRTLIQHLVDQGAERGKAQTAWYEKQVFAAEFFNREAPAERSTDSHGITGL
jgi:hypothetical protein